MLPAQPRCMRRVVRQVVACLPVDEDVKSVAVRLQPGDDAVKSVGIKGELAAPFGVRPYRALVYATHTHLEQLRCPGAKCTGPRYLSRPEIDVGMVVSLDICRALDHASIIAGQYP
jgi:hypothetical protein